MNANLSDLTENMARGVRLAKTPLGVGSKGSLLEAKGYKELVEGIGCDMKRATTALLLDNYRKYRARLGRLDEASTTLQIGSYDKWAFPLLTLVSENLVAQDLVSLQPMEGPNGNIFYMNFVTGQSKGNTPRGSKVWDARTAHADRNTDSSDRINEEPGTLTLAGGLDGTSVDYIPVVPGSLEIIVDPSGTADLVTDDGNGQLVDSGANVVGNINYNNGTFSNSADGDVTMLQATDATVSYNYNPEVNDTAQQIDFEIQSSPIVARQRKLRARWTAEAALSLDALFEEDADDMVSTAITNTLQWEIDREIMEDLRQKASAGVVTWSGNAPANVSYPEHKLTMVDALMTGSNFIHRATNTARANWVVTGTSGSTVIETLPQFEPGSNSTEMEGVCEVGKLNNIKVFTDPHFPVNEVVMGYKGNDLVRTGYVFAPWILLYTTPNIELDDFMTRKGFASYYGKRMVNSKMYSKLVITNPETSFGA